MSEWIKQYENGAVLETYAMPSLNCNEYYLFTSRGDYALAIRVHDSGALVDFQKPYNRGREAELNANDSSHDTRR